MTTVKPTRKPTRYNIMQAHRITGKSRTTIQRHLKSGKLSFVEDGDGNRMIDASELIRVYGDDCNFSSEEQSGGGESEVTTPVHHRVHTLEERIETLVEERKREREQLQSQIDHLKESLQLAQEGHNRATLLLENRSGEGEWREAVSSLEQRFKEREHSLKEHAKIEARREIKSQPWWHLLGRAD